MCGIFGLISLERDATPADAELVAAGTTCLRHRGPDGSDVVTHGKASLGHRRLSIVDLATGGQPMWSHDRRGLISYNGEVYNFAELERDLIKAGRRFVTRSDTEAVLNAFLEWGSDSVKRLRGMFAFAAVDFERKQAILARDRLGKKPLFYTVKDGRLLWSSELEALYETAGPFPIDLGAVDDYLAWQYIAAPRTIYQGVRSLPPAHVATIDLESGEVEERRYWDLNFREDRSMSLEEWGERLDAEIREAVRIRFMSDVPYGAFLSGGIDSSLVVGYMAELMQEPVKTFTIGFREADFSEMKYAEEVARLNKTEHHTQMVEADSLALLPTLVKHYGQPFADASAIPTYYVSRMARAHVKMVLSGDGGDENFAGYNSYEYVLSRINDATTPASAGGPQLWYRELANVFRRKVRRLVERPAMLDELYRYQSETAHHFHPHERCRLWNPEYRDLVRAVDPERRRLLDLEGAPLVTRLQHLDVKQYLPFDILTKVDIAAMANSLEVRVPLLDHHVVELAATIPSEHKLRPDGAGYEKKFLLKQLARKRYPASLIDRPKMGFGVPIGDWMAGSLRREIEERLLESNDLPRFFQMSHINAIWQSHLERRNGTAKVWNLLFLDQWMKTHQAALPSR